MFCISLFSDQRQEKGNWSEEEEGQTKENIRMCAVRFSRCVDVCGCVWMCVDVCGWVWMGVDGCGWV